MLEILRETVTSGTEVVREMLADVVREIIRALVRRVRCWGRNENENENEAMR